MIVSRYREKEKIMNEKTAWDYLAESDVMFCELCDNMVTGVACDYCDEHGQDSLVCAYCKECDTCGSNE